MNPHNSIQAQLRHIPILLALAAFLLCAGAHADSVSKRSSSPAQYPRVQYDGANATQKNFSFSAARLQLKNNGEWTLEGNLVHNGLLCGDYEVGVRFGTAVEGCNEVEWISGDQIVYTQSLCNNATMPYRAVMLEPELEANYDKITCAERIIRCSGTCK